MQMSGGGTSSSAPVTAIFADIRFVLFGFDSVSESQYRSEILRRGGTDVGRYDRSCTHVIVSGRTYDDPVCVAALEDGKTLVTEMWIDDSVDFGVLADATRMLYRPVRSFHGIPGSESLHVCLTGYQKQERDDIMKMVSLMGAKFSKPLIANQVTHLICYKFEGEKYELARKVNIKLVNHRWLEDCLKEWEILPTDNYTKSGWELESLEAKAEDSEEETFEVGRRALRNRSSVGTSTVGNGKSVPTISDLSTPTSVKNIVQKNVTVSKQSAVTDHGITSSTLLTTPSKGSSSRKELNTNNLVREEDFQTSGDSKACAMDDVKSFIPCNSDLKEDGIPSSRKLSSSSSSIGNKLNSLSYSRTSEKKAVSPELSTNFKCSPRVSIEESVSKFDFDISVLAPIEGETSHELAKTQSPNANVNRYLEDASSGSLPQKRKISHSQVGTKSPRLENQNLKASALGSPQQSMEVQEANLSKKKVQEAKCSTILPYGGDDLILGEADQTVQVVGVSDLTEKMQVSPSKSRKATARWKTATGIESSNSVFSSEKNNPDRSGMKQAIGRQNAGAFNPASTTIFMPPTCGTALSHLSLDDEPLLAGDMHKIMSSTKSDFDSLAISGKLNDESSGKDKGTNTFLASVGRQNPTTRDDGETASIEMPNLVSGHTSRSITETTERILSSNCMEEKKKALVTASKMLQESNNKAALATRIKKTVAKKITNKITKLSTTSTKECDVADPDKSASTCNPAVENGKLTVVKAKPVCMETGENLMEEEGELFPEDEKDIYQAKNRDAKRTSSRTKLSTTSRKEGTANTSEPALENGNFRDMDAKPVCNETRKNLMDEPGELLPGDVIMEDIIPTTKTLAKKGTKGRTKFIKVGSSVTDSDKTAITNKHPMESEKLRKTKAKPVREDSRKNLNVEHGVFSPDDVIMENGMKEADHLVTAGICKDATMDGREISKDSEKENMPCDNVIISDNTPYNHKMINMYDKKSIQTHNSRTMEEAKGGKVFRLGPAIFILSGYRVQRKEFQIAIRRLRGRVCRDSHQWSYQATHFIAPNPLRRTEKFFAAAAAGRWILKPDYLIASNDAGKFLDEEPFEVYCKGLTEDGTVSLEAPRKWRLLRERTGHGAFYGMRIIIYGECIAPTLDTMKRVVKAGDGTILATSPPYSRFFRSGVDYAVISPSIPRVDSWVQEFLRHNIPCVTTDYLVEYVCKPGYSLEKHVLYKTHGWAEKSFSNLLSRSEEVIKDAVVVSEGGDVDLNCAVCGQSDRGEVMLICGDEAGNAGCGIGTHIDCCDPPLEAVPEGDWFCPKCTGATTNKTPLKSSKVVKSSSRRK